MNDILYIIIGMAGLGILYLIGYVIHIVRSSTKETYKDFNGCKTTRTPGVLVSVDYNSIGNSYVTTLPQPIYVETDTSGNYWSTIIEKARTGLVNINLRDIDRSRVAVLKQMMMKYNNDPGPCEIYDGPF